MAQSGRTRASTGRRTSARAAGARGATSASAKAAGRASRGSERPGWLQAVLRMERAIGSQVEDFVRSDAYFDLTAELTRQRRRVSKLLEGFQEEWLHLFNLPASTDIRRLREQLARLEREFADLTQELADQREAAEDGRRTPAEADPAA